MADADPAGFAERFFVQRRGDDGANLVVERILRCSLEVLVAGLADLGADVSASYLVDVDVAQVDHVDDPGLLAGLIGVLDRTHFQRTAGDFDGGFERAALTDDQWPRLVVDSSMGQGFGALIMVPTTQYLIDHIGWRSAYVVTAAVLLIAVVPANALLQRRRPTDVGQFPDGDSAPATGNPGVSLREFGGNRDWTLREAAGALPFWSIVIGHFALGTAVFMISTHIVAHYVVLGYERIAAAFIAGLIGFIRIGGTVIWGFVSDRLGRAKAYWLATFVAATGIACFAATPDRAPLWFAYLSAVLFSIGHSAGTPTYGAVIGDIFSGHKLGLIFGFLEISFGLGSAFGAWIGGYLFDLTGSYSWPFSLCLICFAISGFAIQACLRWQARRVSV